MTSIHESSPDLTPYCGLVKVVRKLVQEVQLDAAAQADVATILSDPLLSLLPLRHAYNTRLLKLLIDAIEREQGHAILDDLVEQLAALLTSSSASLSQASKASVPRTACVHCATVIHPWSECRTA